MVLSCIVNNCSNYEGKKNIKITFHTIPSDLSRREHWLNIIKQKVGLKVDVIRSKHAVCSDHFASDCYVKNSRKLTKNAAPSIFEYSSDEFPPVKKTRVDTGRKSKLILRECLILVEICAKLVAWTTF